MSIYDQPPLSFIQQALLSQLGGAPSGGYVPINADLKPAPQAPSYYGPTHRALSQAFQSALMHQMAVPGLLAQMQANPALASQVGGFGMQAYTPTFPKTGINWDPPPAPPAPPPVLVPPGFGYTPNGFYGGSYSYDGGNNGGTNGEGGTGGVGGAAGDGVGGVGGG